MSKVQVQPASDLHEHYLCWPNTFRRPTDDEWYNEVRSLKDELADIKQRLLPQFAGRAQRAERDRDAAQVAAVAAERDARFAEHEQLIEARSATAETAIGHARYEYLRTLNPRKFAALYNEALMGVHQFDDLVDRYRDASRPSHTTKEQPK